MAGRRATVANFMMIEFEEDKVGTQQRLLRDEKKTEQMNAAVVMKKQ